MSKTWTAWDRFYFCFILPTTLISLTFSSCEQKDINKDLTNRLATLERQLTTTQTQCTEAK